MTKYHVWLWPFETGDEEYEELVRELQHLYEGGAKTFRVVDAGVRSHGGWRSRLASETSAPGTEVTIYVMGHTNINFQQVHSHLQAGVGEALDALGLAERIGWVVSCLHPAAPLKIKFLNCRSAHARYPRPTCEAVFNITGRTFTAFAYALDLSTKTLIEGTTQYKTQKEAFFRLGPDTPEIQATTASQARFEVWPELKQQQDDGTPLSEFLTALELAG